jgi:hypothetical protein
MKSNAFVVVRFDGVEVWARVSDIREGARVCSRRRRLLCKRLMAWSSCLHPTPLRSVHRERFKLSEL